MSAGLLDASALRAWAHNAVADLISHTDEINRLNVFPVADADTGTNMLFTMRAAWAQADAHSEADDADPIVATLGGVSIVVPDFASGLVSPSAWAVYRLFPSEGWVELTAGEVDDLIVIGPA